MFYSRRRGLMETETAESLPKTPLPGSVQRQWVRCGRPNCRCARGRLHGPFYYRFWRDAGRLRKQYVPARQLSDTRARCQAHRQERVARKMAWSTWRRIRDLLREVEGQCPTNVN